MIRRKLVAGLSGLAVAGALAGVVATPSGAWAAPAVAPYGQAPSASTVTPAGADFPYEWDTATSASPPSGLPCVSMSGAKACFEKNGDKFWVEDTASDGHSATASWQNWIVADNGDYIWWRQGSCVNKLGSGQWGVCNKDFYESSSVNDLGGQGSDVYWQACVYDSADGTWHGCSTEEGAVPNDA